jgi:hypothetical protein
MTEDQEEKHDTVATRRECGGINQAASRMRKRPLCHEVCTYYTVLAQVFSCAGNVCIGSQAGILTQNSRPAAMRSEAVARLSAWSPTAVGQQQTPGCSQVTRLRREVERSMFFR